MIRRSSLHPTLGLVVVAGTFETQKAHHREHREMKEDTEN